MIPIKDDNPTRKKPIIRLLILCICTTVFLIQTTSSLNNEYIFFFGFKPASLFNPDFNMPTFYPILTIFTSMFMHGGWLHFLGNMLYLWIFADNIEDRIGHKKFIFFYILCGIIAALTQYFGNTKTPIPMIGASGAIAGVLGAYIYLFPKIKITVIVPLIIFFFAVKLPALIVLGFWFIIQFINFSIITDQSSGTAWLAHIGGFLAGLIYAVFFIKRKEYIKGKSKLVIKKTRNSPWT